MAVYPFNVPTLARWLRFSDEHADFYDLSTKNFLDMAGFAATPNSRLADMLFQAGTGPTFAARGANSRKGLLLDNSAYWGFYPVTPYHGSGYMILQPHLSSAAADLYVLLFGANAVPLNAGTLAFHRGSGVNTAIIHPSRDSNGSTTFSSSIVSDSIYMLIWSINQETGLLKVSIDGGTTVVSHTISSLAVSGAAGSLWQSGTTTGEALIKALFGDMDNNTANVTANATDYAYAFEMGEWTTPDVFATYPTQLLAFYNDRKTYFGTV